ncbi:MAG TPA: hypothetical protein VEY69_16500 [Lautropia sp.]|jgi:hypothetical protein|nr:hypothetical protein [Lautropia sp.]
MSHPDTSRTGGSGPGNTIPGTSNSDAKDPDTGSCGTHSAGTVESAVSPETLRALASYADLPLAAGREEPVAAVLGAWLPDVNALSRKMSAPEHQDLAPATTFIHPSVDDREA